MCPLLASARLGEANPRLLFTWNTWQLGSCTRFDGELVIDSPPLPIRRSLFIVKHGCLIKKKEKCNSDLSNLAGYC